MNVPSVFRKALDGFIIPPRTFMQMVVSAGKGAAGLLNEVNRSEFIDKLDKGTINEGVISQATAGPIMMLSLFHDLQNPLLKRNNFDASEFLKGASLALERFHNVSGALENELHSIQEEAKKNVDAESEKSIDESVPEDENESKGAITGNFQSTFSNDLFAIETGDKSLAAVLEHEWMDDAKKDSESLAGQLSRMLTAELFQIHQVSAKTAFLLQNHASKVSFKEGSCIVNNVALLSARSFLCVERDQNEDLESWGERTSGKYELIDYDMDIEEAKKKNGGVAAQMEILYDVTQEFESLGKDDSTSNDNGQSEKMETTIVSVAVLEGWLNGGPDGELRWRLALHRPAFEFPGIQ